MQNRLLCIVIPSVQTDKYSVTDLIFSDHVSETRPGVDGVKHFALYQVESLGGMSFYKGCPLIQSVLYRMSYYKGCPIIQDVL